MEESNSLPTKLHMADTWISYIQDKQEQPKVSSLKKREEASDTIYFPQRYISSLCIKKRLFLKKN